MKYIRTKDGRIAEIKDNMIVKETTIEIINQKGLRLVYKDRPYVCVLNGSEDYIVKQVDTIEELCDEFVVEDTQGLHYRTDDFKGLENTGNKIYGAIWTDKGLIYVAKMNDKGELELV